MSSTCEVLQHVLVFFSVRKAFLEDGQIPATLIRVPRASSDISELGETFLNAAKYVPAWSNVLDRFSSMFPG